MYNLHLQAGTVTRDSDGKIVSPCQSSDDPDFISYIEWVNAGNQPIILDDPLPESKIITMVDFRNRFTDAEMVAILQRAYAGNGDIPLQILLLKLQTSQEIDLSSEALLKGMDYLSLIGIITPERSICITML